MVAVRSLLFDCCGNLRDRVWQHVKRIHVDEYDGQLNGDEFCMRGAHADVEEISHFEKLATLHRRVPSRDVEFACSGDGVIRLNATPPLSTMLEVGLAEDCSVIAFEHPGLACRLFQGPRCGVSVAQYVSLETQPQLLDCLSAVVGDMNIYEDGAAADPHLTMQPRGHFC